METWELRPNVSVGEIRFGMGREELRALLGEDYEVFKYSGDTKNTNDDYHRFHVFYTSDDLVEAVRIFYGEGIEVTLDGTVIFPIRQDEVEKAVPGIVNDEYYPWDYGRSICYAEDAGENDEMFDSITVGREGYYSFML